MQFYSITCPYLKLSWKRAIEWKWINYKTESVHSEYFHGDGFGNASLYLFLFSISYQTSTKPQIMPILVYLLMMMFSIDLNLGFWLAIAGHYFQFLVIIIYNSWRYRFVTKSCTMPEILKKKTDINTISRHSSTLVEIYIVTKHFFIFK